METKELMEKAVKFHGHSCPGLAIGVLAAKYILENGNDFSTDEELVAVVENDSCSVDGIQSLLGTTFGKGNFVFKDYGKNIYTFYNRRNSKAVRLSVKKNDIWDSDMSREERVEYLLSSRPEDIFNIQQVLYDPPDPANIHKSIICSGCGDPVMSSRIKKYNNNYYCIPCYYKTKLEEKFVLA